MPAAAVIPAPIAYIKVVAVKKLVVGSAVRGERSPERVVTVSPGLISSSSHACSLPGAYEWLERLL